MPKNKNKSENEESILINGNQFTIVKKALGEGANGIVNVVRGPTPDGQGTAEYIHKEIGLLPNEDPLYESSSYSRERTNLDKIGDLRGWGIEQLEGIQTFKGREIDRKYHIIMKRIPGVPLDKILQQPLTRLEKLKIALKSAEAINDLHVNFGIVHEDIKPENLMYDENTQKVGIIDLGLSWDLSGAENKRIFQTAQGLRQVYSPPEAVKHQGSSRENNPEFPNKAADEGVFAHRLTFDVYSYAEMLSRDFNILVTGLTDEFRNAFNREREGSAFSSEPKSRPEMTQLIEVLKSEIQAEEFDSSYHEAKKQKPVQNLWWVEPEDWQKAMAFFEKHKGNPNVNVLPKQIRDNPGVPKTKPAYFSEIPQSERPKGVSFVKIGDVIYAKCSKTGIDFRAKIRMLQNQNGENFKDIITAVEINPSIPNMHYHEIGVAREPRMNKHFGSLFQNVGENQKFLDKARSIEVEISHKSHLVTDYNQGVSLREILSTSPHRIKGSWTTRLTVALNCAKALEDIHRKGFIHCDAKPENFVVSDNNEVALTNLHFALRANQNGIGFHKPQGGLEDYTAPEIAYYKREPTMDYLNPRIHTQGYDVYALGVLLQNDLGLHGFDDLLDPVVENRPTVSAVRERLQNALGQYLESKKESRARPN